MVLTDMFRLGLLASFSYPKKRASEYMQKIAGELLILFDFSHSTYVSPSRGKRYDSIIRH